MRYFLVKFTRTKMIAFDIDDALAFEGESGPYLQYSVVRAQNIFAKLAARDGLTEDDLVATAGDDAGRRRSSPATTATRCGSSRSRRRASTRSSVQAVRGLEPAVLAKYAFGLAQAFNARLPSLPHPQRGARGAPAVARRRDQRLPAPAHRGARH